MSEDKNPPTGIKILSILYYLGFGFLILSGILIIILGIFANSFLQEYVLAGNIITVLAIIASIILIGVGILNFFIARGLWVGKNWARIVVIVFSLISVFSSLISIFLGNSASVFSLPVSILIAGYLLLNKNVKEFFA